MRRFSCHLYATHVRTNINRAHRVVTLELKNWPPTEESHSCEALQPVLKVISTHT